MLGVNDLKQVIERLVGSQNRLPENDIKFLIQVKMVSLRFEFQLILWFLLQNILVEADLDDDGALSFPEFEHIIDKSSDFTKWVLFTVNPNFVFLYDITLFCIVPYVYDCKEISKARRTAIQLFQWSRYPDGSDFVIIFRLQQHSCLVV